MENYLYYGDNLEIMKKLLDKKGGFIDLVYIDPPFNSKRNYNILYKDRLNELDTIQKEVFKDTWSNVEYQKTIEEVKALGLNTIDEYLTFIKKTMPISFVSYLSMMSIRIYYIKKLLKKTGSFYLHCDPTMSHYLKTLCDLTFGNKNFRNEIIWHYSDGTNPAKDFKRKHDVILRYTRGREYTFNQIKLEALNKKRYNKVEEETNRKYFEDTHHGRYKRYYLDDGRRIDDVWSYLEDKKFRQLNSQSNERVEGKYPTQKPMSILDRIIEASSNEGDMVADFFCGCGTTIDSAIKNKRNFIGCDISTLSIAVIEKRLKERNGFKKDRDFEVDGLPKNLEQARKLSIDDIKNHTYKFQDWAVEYLCNAISNNKKTGDGGIDGNFYFSIPGEVESRRCIIQIKGGKNLSINEVRSFLNTCKKNDCAGLFLTMGHITDGMKEECYSLGSLGYDIYKCDIVSIKDLMEGKRPVVLEYNITHKKPKQLAQEL